MSESLNNTKINCGCKPKSLFRFVVLVPHRDSLIEFNNYHKNLFSISAALGAFFFPPVIILAGLDMPLESVELKAAAKKFRSITKEKFRTENSSFMCYGDGAFFFGSVFPFDTGAVFEEKKGVSVFSKAMLCCLFSKNEAFQSNGCPAPPAVSFRTGALANMVLDVSNDANSIEWKIGKLFWLQK